MPVVRAPCAPAPTSQRKTRGSWCRPPSGRGRGWSGLQFAARALPLLWILALPSVHGGCLKPGARASYRPATPLRATSERGCAPRRGRIGASRASLGLCVILRSREGLLRKLRKIGAISRGTGICRELREEAAVPVRRNDLSPRIPHRRHVRTCPRPSTARHVLRDIVGGTMNCSTSRPPWGTSHSGRSSAEAPFAGSVETGSRRIGHPSRQLEVLDINAEWHAANAMPKNPTVEQRVHWHLAHQTHCACRPIPPELASHIDRGNAMRSSQPAPRK
jgi:hypothetical protein